MYRFADLLTHTHNTNSAAESKTKRAKTTIVAPVVADDDDDDDGARAYTTFAEKNDKTRKRMVNQMRQVAVLLDHRRVVPSEEHERAALIENELALLPQRGAASVSTFRPLQDVEALQQTSAALRSVISKNNTGQYDLLEFADMLSERTEASTTRSHRVAAEAKRGGIHSHEPRQTLFKSVEHKAEYEQRFRTDECFEYMLFDEQSVALGSLLLCPQHDSAAMLLEALRNEPPALPCNTTAEWCAHIFRECGLRFFCAYTSDRDHERLSLVYSADSSDRFFLIFVFAATALTRPCIEEAKVWNEEAEKVYEKRMQSTEFARETFKPCVARFDALDAHARFWALYTPTMCPSFNQVTCRFMYAYYTTCQCVKLT